VLIGAWASLMAWLARAALVLGGADPVILGWATWLRAPDWVAEKTTRHAGFARWRRWLVPALAVSAAVIAFRVYEIPAVQPRFPEASTPPVSDEERATWNSIAKPPSC